MVPEDDGVALRVLSDGFGDSLTKKVIFTAIFHNGYNEFFVKVTRAALDEIENPLDHVLVPDLELISFVKHGGQDHVGIVAMNHGSDFGPL